MRDSVLVPSVDRRPRRSPRLALVATTVGLSLLWIVGGMAITRTARPAPEFHLAPLTVPLTDDAVRTDGGDPCAYFDKLVTQDAWIKKIEVHVVRRDANGHEIDSISGCRATLDSLRSSLSERAYGRVVDCIYAADSAYTASTCF